VQPFPSPFPVADAQVRQVIAEMQEWLPLPGYMVHTHTHAHAQSGNHQVSSIRHVQRHCVCTYICTTMSIMTENYSTLKNSLADFTFAHDDAVRVFLFLLAVFLYLFTVISTRSLFPMAASSGQVFVFGFCISALRISRNVS